MNPTSSLNVIDVETNSGESELRSVKKSKVVWYQRLTKRCSKTYNAKFITARGEILSRVDSTPIGSKTVTAESTQECKGESDFTKHLHGKSSRQKSDYVREQELACFDISLDDNAQYSKESGLVGESMENLEAMKLREIASSHRKVPLNVVIDEALNDTEKYTTGQILTNAILKNYHCNCKKCPYYTAITPEVNIEIHLITNSFFNNGSIELGRSKLQDYFCSCGECPHHAEISAAASRWNLVSKIQQIDGVCRLLRAYCVYNEAANLELEFMLEIALDCILLYAGDEQKAFHALTLLLDRQWILSCLSHCC
jgi:hypothetical protein